MNEEEFDSSKKVYANFMEIALSYGMSLTNIKIAIGEVFEVAYRLKLKEEELRGVFLALERMASKSVVKIMANAVDMYVEELDEVLKSHLPEDALPRFASEIEKLYAPEVPICEEYLKVLNNLPEEEKKRFKN